MVAEPQTIFWVGWKRVPAVQKIFSLEQTMVSGIETMVWVKKTMVATSQTTVKAEKKMVSLAPTMVCKVLSIEFLIVEQSSAIPKLVCFWSSSPLASEFSLEIRRPASRASVKHYKSHAIYAL